VGGIPDIYIGLRHHNAKCHDLLIKHTKSDISCPVKDLNFLPHSRLDEIAFHIIHVAISLASNLNPSPLIPMKYHISRNLSFGRKPCPEAYPDGYTRVELRTVSNPERIPAFAGCYGDWFESGQAHVNSSSTISRHLDDQDWFVNIDDLGSFIAKYGPIKLRACVEDAAPGAMEIEMLDDLDDTCE